jgi:CzcA family heavy metal efflux pump
MSDSPVSHAGGAAPQAKNLVARARPFFGLIVLSTLLLAAFGVYSVLQMPSGIYPEVAFPRIVVIAQSAGLAVKDVDIAITRPVEEAVSIVLGVKRVSSKSVRGASEIHIEFNSGTDMVQALNDIRARMAEVGPQLPPGTTTLTERQTPSIFPIISFAVTGGHSPTELYDYAFYDLRPRISRIPDVSYVTAKGGDVREIVVEVEPETLAALGLSIAEVADRLNKEHRLKAVGRMDQETQQYQVLVNSQANQASELAERVITYKNNQPVRLGDIGRVAISHVDRTMVVRSNGKDAVAVTVFRRLGGNALAVSDALKLVLEDAAKSAPAGISIHPVYDQGDLVRAAVGNVRDAIVIGGLLSVAVLVAFLRSWRATVIAALSIPLSLVISFVFLRLSGDTLNLMSLGGLAVAIGLIIDDSVVVIENISRHLALGQTGDRAIDQASREISGAVIGSTLTTILVFLPLAWVSGVTGQFFQSLSISLSVAILVSMVVSLTMIPVLAAKFMGSRAMPHSGPIYQFLADRYEAVLKIALHYPRVTVIAALLAVLPGWWLFHHLESDFMPEMDEGAFVLDYHMPVGTSLAQTDQVLRRVERLLNETPDVNAYIRRTGAEMGLFATEAYTGDVLVSLKPSHERRPAEEIFTELRERLKAEVPELASEVIPLIHDQINDLSGVKAPIEVKVFGPDLATLRQLATQVGAIVEAIPGAADVNTHVLLGNPDIVIRPSSLQTAQVGLTDVDLELQLNAALYGQVATLLPQQDRMTAIRVRYPDRVRYDRAGLGQLPIALPPAANLNPTSNSAPNFLPLSQLATIEVVRSPNEMWRENQQPVITVNAELEKRDLGSVVTELQTKLSKERFPAGYRWEIAGNYLSQKESFTSLFRVMLFASAIVFLLLGFQFKSLVLPLLIFLAQPVSLTSALFALWLTKTPLNVSSFMGAILLIGLDVKNGILLIEYISQLRKEGMPLDEALLQAGRARFRPILMTSLSAIFGLLPLAFGFGPGAQMQQPLAIAVIGGLITNMLLTRMLIPVGYRLLSNWSDPQTGAVGQQALAVSHP